MELDGLKDSFVVIEPKRTYELGPFAVRFIPSRHSTTSSPVSPGAIDS